MNTIALPTPALSIHRQPQAIVALPATTITRHHQLGADFTVVRRLGLNELHVTIQPEPDDTIAMMLLRLDTILREHNAIIARMDVFGAVAARVEFLTAMRRLMGEVAWPVTWIDGAGFDGSPIAGLHVFAVVGVNVESISVGGRIAGRVFSEPSARHCVLGDIIPRHARTSRAEQAREVFDAMQVALDLAGMSVNDIARTWLYLDRPLGWYGKLDRACAQLSRKWAIFESGVPASVEIGAGNPHGVAIVAGAWAMVPTNGGLSVRAVRSPLQRPADDSRSDGACGMEWNTPGHRRITVSSTANIALGGASGHKRDINTQVDLAMDVIEALLVSRGLDFSDVTRATTYVKSPRHASALDDWFERQRLWFPAVIAHADVCRDESLFGIELDAIMEKPPLRAS